MPAPMKGWRRIKGTAMCSECGRLAARPMDDGSGGDRTHACHLLRFCFGPCLSCVEDSMYLQYPSKYVEVCTDSSALTATVARLSDRVWKWCTALF